MTWLVSFCVFGMVKMYSLVLVAVAVEILKLNLSCMNKSVAAVKVADNRVLLLCFQCW